MITRNVWYVHFKCFQRNRKAVMIIKGKTVHYVFWPALDPHSFHLSFHEEETYSPTLLTGSISSN